MTKTDNYMKRILLLYNYDRDEELASFERFEGKPLETKDGRFVMVKRRSQYVFGEEKGYDCVYIHGRGIEQKKDGPAIVYYSSASGFYEEMFSSFQKSIIGADGEQKQKQNLAEAIFDRVEKFALPYTLCECIAFVKHRIINGFAGLHLDLDSLKRAIKNRDTEAIEKVFEFWKQQWGGGFMKAHSPFTLLMQAWFLICKKSNFCRGKEFEDKTRNYFPIHEEERLEKLFDNIDFCPDNVPLPKAGENKKPQSLGELLDGRPCEDQLTTIKSTFCMCMFCKDHKTCKDKSEQENGKKGFDIFRFCLSLDVFVFIYLESRYSVDSFVNEKSKNLFFGTGIPMDFEILDEIEGFKKWLEEISNAFDKLKQELIGK